MGPELLTAAAVGGVVGAFALAILVLLWELTVERIGLAPRHSARQFLNLNW